MNIIISKSGNTIETITNANIFIKKDDKNIFITQNKKNYLFDLAHKLKSEIIEQIKVLTKYINVYIENCLSKKKYLTFLKYEK